MRQDQTMKKRAIEFREFKILGFFTKVHLKRTIKGSSSRELWAGVKASLANKPDLLTV